MNVALIGLPQSGKSTVFSAVTGREIDPYAQPETQQAVVSVPDERLTFLTKMWNPKKVVQATIHFSDIPGCSLADIKGQEDWRRLLPEVRKADLLVIVVRDFKNDSVPAYNDRIDPKKDFEAVWEEMIFADLDTVTTRTERIEAALKKPTKNLEIEKRELALLTHCREALEEEQPLSSVIQTEEDRRMVSSFAFLTEKPLVCVRNVSDDDAAQAEGLTLDYVTESFSLSASIEAEIAALEPEDRIAFLQDLGLETPARDRLIQVCYRAVGMISFLTMGKDEVRAWTITRGNTAVEASGKIHTDLARGFIRAETIAYDDLVTHADVKGVKAAGLVRKEGKTYIVQDGDILNILSSA